MRRQRPSIRLGLFQGVSIRRLHPAYHLFMLGSSDLVDRQIQHARESRVAALNRVIRRQYQNAIRSRVEQRIQALFFMADLAVKLRIIDSDGCLVGETLQQGAIVRREDAWITAKDKNNPDHLLAGDQGQTYPGE